MAGQMSDLYPKAEYSGYRTSSERVGNQEKRVWRSDWIVPLRPAEGGKKTVWSYVCTT
jgi:hypothetical protein